MLHSSTRLCLIACRLLVSEYRAGRRICAPKIAEHYKMNVRMLNQSLNMLVRCGILLSKTGGDNPGYIFARDPQLISLRDVWFALEGDTALKCCREILTSTVCDILDPEDCLVYATINHGYMRIKNELTEISLQQYYDGKQMKI